MIVHFERSGGFAGLRKNTTIDSDKLSSDEQQKLSTLLEAADFFNLPNEIRSSAESDRFEYKISVDDKGKKHEIRIDEAAAPVSIRPLLEWLNARSSKQG